MVKNRPANGGDTGSISGWGRAPRVVGNGNLLWHSFLGNPIDRGAWGSTVEGVKESDMTE